MSPEDDETTITPMMEMMPALVKTPFAEMLTMPVPQFGGVSVGPGHLPVYGGAVFIGLHTPDGQSIIAVLGRARFTEFASMVTAAVDRIDAGEFDKPHTTN